MKSNMHASYNLRSSQRKRNISGVNCYLKNLENVSPEAFNPKVRLERLKLLECHDIQNSRFYLQKDGIKVKKNKSIFSNKIGLLKVFCAVLLLVTSIIYWRVRFITTDEIAIKTDYLQTNGIALIKRCAEINPTIQNYYIDAVKFQKNILNKFVYKKQKAKKEEKPILQVSKENTIVENDNIEIRKLVKEYFVQINKKNKIQNTVKSPQSFIEEQCKVDTKVNPYSKKKVFYNVTFHDMANLTDFALESQGAKILNVFNTELYGTITIKYLNLNLWPELSHFLMKYLKCFKVNGPNSILMPWKKPGDCWAFKGSRGRVQIRLSDKIIITAITVEHIPKDVASKRNIQSAPKKFSLSGVEESEKANKTLLGSYEYEIYGPAAQTFFIQPKIEIPFRIVEVAFESNHGNDKYTCIYKIRIHGRK